MTDRQILLRAAELIDAGAEHFSCLAIWSARGRNRPLVWESSIAAKYTGWFSPYPNTSILESRDIIQACGTYDERKEFRVLLLLMARAAWKDLK